MFVYIMFIHPLYCRYFVGSERDREKQEMLGPSILPFILPVGTLLHTQLEKPTHSLISVLEVLIVHCLHITRECLVVAWDPSPRPTEIAPVALSVPLLPFPPYFMLSLPSIPAVKQASLLTLWIGWLSPQLLAKLASP